MPLITTATQRAAEKRAIKGVIAGETGVGKTTLAKTLDPETTLVIDLEAGMLAIEGWPGDSLNVRHAAVQSGVDAWDISCAVASVLAGADPNKRPDQKFSAAYHEYAVGLLGGDPYAFDKYETIFVDSITVAGRLSFNWSMGQPGAMGKNGAPDKRGAYGLHGLEMIDWATQLQHAKKNVWLVGILDEKTDDFNRTVWKLQIEGSKAGLALPGIVDQVISMVQLKDPDDKPYRAFVCHTLNPWGYPAKDRSGRLEMVEEPHLGELMDKMTSGKRLDSSPVHGLPVKQIDDDIPFSD